MNFKNKRQDKAYLYNFTQESWLLWDTRDNEFVWGNEDNIRKIHIANWDEIIEECKDMLKLNEEANDDIFIFPIDFVDGHVIIHHDAAISVKKLIEILKEFQGESHV